MEAGREGGRGLRERENEFFSLDFMTGAPGRGVTAPCDSGGVSSGGSESVRVLCLKVSRYSSAAVPVCSLPAEHKHNNHWRPAFVPAHPPPAVTLFNRNKSPDGGGGGGEKKSHLPLLTSLFLLMTLLMTSLTTLLQKLHAAPCSTLPPLPASPPLFSSNIWPAEQGRRLISGALASSVYPPSPPLGGSGRCLVCSHRES